MRFPLLKHNPLYMGITWSSLCHLVRLRLRTGTQENANILLTAYTVIMKSFVSILEVSSIHEIVIWITWQLVSLEARQNHRPFIEFLTHTCYCFCFYRAAGIFRGLIWLLLCQGRTSNRHLIFFPSANWHNKRNSYHRLLVKVKSKTDLFTVS